VPWILDVNLTGHQDVKARERCKYKEVLVRRFVTIYIIGFLNKITILNNWLNQNLINQGNRDVAIAWF
jgi:hypothetical protein